MKEKIIHGFVWLYLLTKRLLKKPVFLLTLLLIPVLAFVMSWLVQEESDIMRIALYTKDNDAVAQEIIDDLITEDSILHFQYYPSEDAAIEAVKTAKADSAWGFCENFSSRLKTYADTNRGHRGMIEVWEREEDNITLRLARERLYGALIPVLSKEVYKSYLSDELAYDIEANRELVEEKYQEAHPKEQLVKFSFVDEDASLASVHYLSTPLRGMIAVLMVVCGIAAAMVFLRERENGIYAYLSNRRQLPVLMASCFTALCICACVALLALKLSGNFTSWPREIGVMALYVIASTFFCTLIAQLCQKASVLAVCLPVLVVLLLVFCPIFLNHSIGVLIQYSLPTCYYLHAIYSNEILLKMFLFIFVWAMACIVVEECKHRFAKG